MTGRAKNESLSVILNGLLQIPHLSQLLKPSGNGIGEIIERSASIWMTRRAKNKSLLVVLDGLLQILHLSQPLEANGNDSGEVIERCEAT
jgi:hypothetical protein